MIRLPDALTHPLWPDSPARRSEAVCSFCLIGPFGLLAGAIYEVRVAPVVGVLLFGGAGAPSAATAGLAVGLGGIYAFLSGVALCGEGAGAVFTRLVGLQGSPTRGAPEFSYEASLVQRGRYDEVEAAYRGRIEEDPEELAPYFRLARLLDAHPGSPHAQWARQEQSRVKAVIARGSGLELLPDDGDGHE